MSLSSGGTVYTGDRKRWRLGKLLKSGGAGSVYPLVEAPGVVAKIYHDGPDRAGYERKVAAMLELSPNLPDLLDGGRRYAQIAWPQALLRDERGSFAGFTMPLIDVQATSELECILQERQAKAANLPTGLGAKITLAANLCAVIAELHRQGHCVIDLKPVNVRFYRQTLYMAMLDCDGFSIQGRGERFAAQQITPDYLAPEFQNHPIAPSLEQAQDRFALAVVIFQLLNFGIHPFTGRPTADSVPTDIPGRIACRCYAYGLRANTQLLPSPVSGHASMPAELRALFDRAFEGAGTVRPSAPEWASVLAAYAQRSQQRVVACAQDRQHQHYAGMPCAACARVALIASTARNAPSARRALSIPKPVPTTLAGAIRGMRVPHLKSPVARQQTSPPGALPPSALAMLAALRLTTNQRTTPSTPITIRQFGVILAVIATFALASFAMNARLDYLDSKITMETPFRHPPPPPAQPPVLAVAPVADPAPSPEDPLQDPGVLRAKIQSVLQAMRADNEYTLFDLHLIANPSHDARIDTYHDAFVFFAASAPPRDAEQRRNLRDALEREHTLHVHDSMAAFELGWLSLDRGDRATARGWFERAIGDNPERAEAWYGLGVVANGDDDETIAALSIAELLANNESEAQQVRAQFSADLLQSAGVDPGRFTKLQARAHAAAQRMSGIAAPAGVSASSPR